MKKRTLPFLIALLSLANFAFAQNDTKTVRLEQTSGEFTVKSLELEAGTYQFEIFNNNVDHEVGFVLAPQGKPEQKHHITEAYVKQPVKKGKSSLTSEVTLAKGEYIYFCPLNPTPQYKLIVK